MKALLVGLGIIATALMVAPPAAHAVLISEVFNLTSDHCTGGCGPANTIFGNVTLIQNGTTVDVTVHLNSPFGYANTGAADNQAFKFNDSDPGGLADITVAPHTPGLLADTGAFNGGGTGNFAFGISCPTCGPGGSTPFFNDIVFHVATATIAELTAPNNLGNVFVADVFNSTTGNTGPVDASGPVGGGVGGSLIPEPATLLLLGSGLLGLGLAGRVRGRLRK